MKRIVFCLLLILMLIGSSAIAANVQMNALTDASATATSNSYLVGYDGATSIRLTIGSLIGLYFTFGTPEQGDILYYNGTSYVPLAHSTVGYLLKSGGHGADPSWVSLIVQAGPANILTYTGNFSLGITLTGNTTVTFPTSGTLVTTSQLATDNSTASHWLYKDSDGHIENAVISTGLTDTAGTLTVTGVKSAATTGQMTITGPAAGETRVATIPDANFSVARTDAGQTFTGVNIFTAPTITTSIAPTVAGASTLGTTAYEWGNLYLTDSAVIYGQADQSNSITSAATGWTFAKPITVSDVTNDNYIKITNNSGGRAPTASVYEIYPDAGIWKVNQNGTESAVVISPAAGQVSFTGPTAARAFALPDAEATVQVASACTALTPGGAVALTVTTYTNCFTDTVTDNEDQTITFSGAGYAGQEITIIFTTAGTSDEVITFHSTLVSSTGTLTLGTDAGKYYTIRFISNGTHWFEVSRTAVQT